MNLLGSGAAPGCLVLDARFHDPDACVLSVRGAVDHPARRELETALARAADLGRPVIVDLAAMMFGDEALLGLLLNARQMTPLLLVGPLAPSFKRRLAVIGTEGIFTIHPTLSQTLATLPR